MFKKTTYTQRRNQLKKTIGSGIILIMGNNLSPMNYKDNTYHFRQDSNFLYYFGLDHEHLAGVIDIDQNKEIIIGEELTMDDVVWMGPQASLLERAQQVGISQINSFEQLQELLITAKGSGRTIHFLPPYRFDNKILLSRFLNIPIEKLKENASIALIKAVVQQRSCKSPEEVEEMEKALATTYDMHLTAMRNAKPGMTEAQLAGKVEGIALSAGGALSYPVILTINGHILHNHYHGNVLQKGQMILGDFGAETGMHYAGDITRCFPINKQFTNQQKEIYQIVLDAEVSCIEALRAGVVYKTIHLQAAKIIANGLKDLGLMQGDIDEAVAAGAHALFFPHGLGHMIGLDVHDMEDLGEDYVGYSDTVTRSTQFGTAYLRLGKKLEEGFVLTVEPGCYFIPELIDQWEADGKFKNFINYNRLKDYRDFTGIRIEDNVLITKDSHRILGPAIPKTIAEVEAIRREGLG